MKPEKYIPLVERARKGDHEAFAELVRGYQDLVAGSLKPGDVIGEAVQPASIELARIVHQ